MITINKIGHVIPKCVRYPLHKKIHQFQNKISEIDRFVSMYFFPKRYVNILGRRVYEKAINIDNPQTLDDKIHWVKLYTDTSMWPLLADKLRVREFVKSKGLGTMLVPMLAFWEDARAINFDNLPPSFILKANNGSGDGIIVRDKTKADINEIRTYFDKLLHTKYGIASGELHYKKIKPCVICEEILYVDPKISSTLVDYKILCFNGEPKFIYCCYNRTKEHVDMELYDTEWHNITEQLKEINYVSKGIGLIEKPERLDEMLEACRILSKDMPLVRVDFFYDKKPYFAEITLTSNAGFNMFFSDELQLKMGRMIQLPKRKVHHLFY